MAMWIAFTRDQALVSKVIRWVTGGHFSHALIVWRDDHFGRWLRLEADWDGFHIRPAKAPFPFPMSIDRGLTRTEPLAIEVPADYSKGLLKIASASLGTRYDYEGALGFAWVALGRLFKKRWKNPLASPSALFCSEAIAEAFKDLGHPNFVGEDPALVDPQRLFDLLSRDSKRVWVVDV